VGTVETTAEAGAFDDFSDDGGGANDLGKGLAAVRILAAEDHPTNQLVLTTIMDIFGVELTLVSNGRQAVEAWAESDFDLVLMDVQMPEMDGVTATRLIREREADTGRRRTPIIALSANAFSHQITAYTDAGMDAHVAKPIDMTLLQREMERALSSVDFASQSV
jgi:CheY-like chemotaxis protein